MTHSQTNDSIPKLSGLLKTPALVCAFLLGCAGISPTEAQTNLVVTKTAPSTVAAGDNLTYSLSLANTVFSTANNVVLSDTLPPDTTFVSARQVGGSGFTLTAPAVGATGTVKFSASALGLANVRAGGITQGNFTNLNGTLIFAAYDGVNGNELWRSDGTDSGTTLVKDIYSGINSSILSTASPFVNPFVNLNGAVYFAASNRSIGQELWKTDGTASGTTLVKDIYPGSNSSSPSDLRVVGNTFFFTASTNDNTGTELWRSDGTDSGTTLVKDIYPGFNSSSITSLRGVNGILFFVATDGASGSELWKSDGTETGTALVKDINPGSASSTPVSLTDVNGTLFFVADDGVTGTKLWKSDGTAAGTVPVKDIYLQANDNITNLINVNGTLFFRAIDNVYGLELWKSDGTDSGTVLVKDICPGSDGSGPSSLTNVNGTLFFSAFDEVNGNELWKSDGTAVGTVLVKDIYAGGSSSGPFNLVDVNGTLFFRAIDNVYGLELWKSDGTDSGTVLVKDICPGSASSRSDNASDINFANVNGTLFFLANDGATGNELWKSDGTAAGTILVKDILAPAKFEIVVNVSTSKASGTTILNTATASTTSTDSNLSNNSASATTLVDAPQPGSTLLVTNLKDSGTGSLRDALNTANSVAGDDVITFASGLTGTITLSGTQLVISSNVSILGPSLPIAINGNQTSRVFLITAGRALIRDLTITGGKVNGGGATNSAGDGGGIRQNDGMLTLENCTLSNNTVINGFGGGMVKYGGIAILRNCTIARNAATGLSSTAGAGAGGGLDFEAGSSIISNCTIADNSAPHGGGLFLASATSNTFDNTIVALNNSGAQNTFADVVGSANSAGYNLIGMRDEGYGSAVTSPFTATGDKGGSVSAPLNPVFRTEPATGRPALAFVGGPTQNIALLSGSPAINAGQTDLLNDQRGFPRPQGSADDIGALESSVSTTLSGALISEFRLDGPSGPSDEFIELYNVTNSALNVSGWSVGTGTVLASIPPDTTFIPPHGHLLLRGSFYSLSNYGGAGVAQGDVSYDVDISYIDTLILRNASRGVVDRVGSSTLVPAARPTSQYSYARRLSLSSGLASSLPSDFNLVDVSATTFGPDSVNDTSNGKVRLGSPGPENLSSPLNRSVLYTDLSANASDNSVRNASDTSVAPLGTLSLRRTVTNNTGSTLTKVRFRLINTTSGTPTGASASSLADVRVVDGTTSFVVNGVTVMPITVEKVAGATTGALNSTFTIPLPQGGLTNGSQVSIDFKLGVFKTGSYRLAFLFEVLP